MRVFDPVKDFDTEIIYTLCVLPHRKKIPLCFKLSFFGALANALSAVAVYGNSVAPTQAN